VYVCLPNLNFVFVGIWNLVACLVSGIPLQEQEGKNIQYIYKKNASTSYRDRVRTCGMCSERNGYEFSKDRTAKQVDEDHDLRIIALSNCGYFRRIEL